MMIILPPLRIKLFVTEHLPRLAAALSAGTLKKIQVAEAISEALKNPTDAMRKALRKLSVEQKWVLIALVQEKGVATIAKLQNALTRLHPLDVDLAQHLELLDLTFVSLTPRRVSWVHPSYGDLVVEQLELDHRMASQFVEHCSFEGIELLLSHAGGEKGQRVFPMMKPDKHWEILTSRLVNIVGRGHEQFVLKTLRLISNALAYAGIPDSRLINLTKAVLKALSSRWDNTKDPPGSVALLAFSELRKRVGFVDAFPNVSALWLEVQSRFSENLEKSRRFGSLQAEAIRAFAEFARALRGSNVQYFDNNEFQKTYLPSVREIIQIVKEDANADLDFDPDILMSESERLESLATALEKLSGLFPALDDDLNDAINEAGYQAETLHEKSQESPDGELFGEHDDYRSAPSEQAFDLETLFRDL